MLELAIAEREGLPPAARSLAAEGAQLALSLVDVEPGSERAVAAALGWRASAVVADDPAGGLALLRRARDAGLGSLAVLVGSPARRVAELPVVPLDDLLASTVPAVTVEGFGFDPGRGELWFAGETAEAMLLELDARRRELAGGGGGAEAERGRRRHGSGRGAGAGRRRRGRVRPGRAPPRSLTRSIRLSCAGWRRAPTGSTRSCSPRRRSRLGSRSRCVVGAESGSDRAAALGSELARVGALEHEAGREASRANERAAGAELLRARLGGEGQIRMLHVDESERDTVEREARDLADEAERLLHVASELAETARDAGSAVAETGARRAATLDADLLGRVLAGAERLDETLAAAAEAAARFDAPLRARVDAGASRTGELGAKLRELGAGEVELRQSAEEAAQRATEIEIELTRIDAEAADAQRRRDEAEAEPAEGDDRSELAARVERLEARRIQLGQVNPLAKEEYDAEKERLEELETQREDLERSLKELEELRADLAATVERRFAETFGAVAEHFEEVAATLFPGGDGRLRLVEPDEDGAGEPTPGGLGIEVELRPAGQEDHAARDALGRREGARRDLLPLRALPREAVPVLPPRRGGGRARRRQHRPLRRAACAATPIGPSSW